MVADALSRPLDVVVGPMPVGSPVEAPLVHTPHSSGIYSCDNVSFSFVEMAAAQDNCPSVAAPLDLVGSAGGAAP